MGFTLGTRLLQSSQFESLHKADMLHLTQKTVFLVALACGRRSSEIHAISGRSSDIAFTRQNSAILRFLPEFLAKNQKTHMPSPSLEILPLSALASTEDAPVQNCPVRALRKYLSRTQLRRSSSQRRLFLPLSKNREKDIVKSTLAGWIAKVIRDAYHYLASGDWEKERRGGTTADLWPLIKPRAHEVRAWATSLAAQSCLRLEDVLAAAYWHHDSVFTGHYLRDIRLSRNDSTYGMHVIAAAHLSSI